MYTLQNEIKGKHVVSLKEGLEIGTVHEIFYSPSKKRVSGLQLKDSWFSGDLKWVSINSVARVGEDFIFIPEKKAASKRKPSGKALKQLAGMQVATQGGDILGYLVDVDVNENWEIVEIRLSGLRAVKIDPRHAVFGKDTVLVTDDDVKVRSTGNRRPGFMESVLGRNTILSVSEALSRKETSSDKGKKAGAKQKRKSGKRKKSGDTIRKIAKSRAKQSRGGGGSNKSGNSSKSKKKTESNKSKKSKKKGSGSGDKKKSNQ